MHAGAGPGFGGGDGVVTLAGDTASSDAPAAVAVQPDGRIVVLFESGVAGTYLTLARFDPDGSPDASFGTNGRVAPGWIGFASFDGDESASVAAVQPDGRLVVAGTVPSQADPQRPDVGIHRYDLEQQS